MEVDDSPNASKPAMSVSPITRAGFLHSVFIFLISSACFWMKKASEIIVAIINV